MRARSIPAALALAAALAACGGTAAPGNGGGAARGLAVIPLDAPTPAGEGPVARVEVASDPAARQKGLMHRPSLATDTGMLFAYPDDAPRAFWMKDTRIPLAAAFLDGSGRILNIHEMLPATGPPGADVKTYPSRGPARFVLEMESGWFARKGIREGDLVDLGAAMKGVAPR